MKRLLALYGIVLSLGMTVLLFASFYLADESDSVIVEKGASVTEQPIAVTGTLPQVITSSIDLNREYDFAGETLPKGNFDALERLDRERSVNSSWQSNTLLNLKSSNRFFPIIEPILAKHGIPDDFKYLAVAESNLRNETSPAGAKGIWQFMKATGANYGLEINSEVDERYHLEKATEAACKFLSDYHKQFGSWTLAAAAYNMGGPRMKDLLEDQKAETYYDLNLNPETSRYVFRVIAIKEILRNPVAFGFYLEDKQLYEPLEYQVIQVDGPVPNWGDFAREHGTTYRMLKVFNPWLISNTLSNRGGETYEIKIPIV